MFWCSLTVCLDVWNLQSFECSHNIICQCCVEWKYYMFCSSELWDSFAFVIKHFWYCHVEFVSLTGNQRFVSAWTSCVCFAGLTRFCSLSSELILFRWSFSLDIGEKISTVIVKTWTCSVHLPSTCGLQLMEYSCVQNFLLFRWRLL